MRNEVDVVLFAILIGFLIRRNSRGSLYFDLLLPILVGIPFILILSQGVGVLIIRLMMAAAVGILLAEVLIKNKDRKQPPGS